jgi:aryl-phospho-beta-D-glucosidase BglC (GH1 family)
MLMAWGNLMKLYGQKWNVFALDLKNEPHGVATWVR